MEICAMLASAPALSTLKPRNGPNHTLHTGTQNFRLETGTRLPWAWIFYISKKPILHKEIKPILLLFIVYSIYIVFAVYPEAGLRHPGLHPRHLHPLLPAVRQVAPDHGDMMICVLCREEIASTVLEVFGVACDPWGIVVERVEVKCHVMMIGVREHSSCQREISQCPYYAFTNKTLC